jgi:parallel beta-helix repeat protein
VKVNKVKEIAGNQPFGRAGFIFSVAHPIVSTLHGSMPRSRKGTRISWATFCACYSALKLLLKRSCQWTYRVVTCPLNFISGLYLKRPTMIIIRTLLFFIALTAGQQLAHATNYYIDSERGSDFWNGKLPTAAGGSSANGPWQTLSRLATASLVPGDTVYLACGSTWNETLRVASSGTSAAPIVISADPGSCENPPVIDGAVAIPSHMWTQYKGSIYRAQVSSIEHIANPRLSANLDGWTSWSPEHDASMSLDTACSGSPAPCMAYTSGSSSGIIISNNFPLAGGMKYTASALIKAPAGTPLKLVIRRGGPTYESFVPEQYVKGSGMWQTVSFTFVAAKSAPNARFDFEVQAGRAKVNLREVHVRRVLPSANMVGVFVDGAGVRGSHHPNFGQVGTDANSPFAKIATAGGTTIVDTAGLPLPANASLATGLGITIRTQPWRMEERKITAVAGSRLTLDTPTGDTIRAGFGYFLTGALWMLDSPGEWFFDSSTGYLYIWMPGNSAPENRVSFSSLAAGADLRKKSYLNVSGIDVRRVGTGVMASMANTLHLQNVALAEIMEYGIDADGCQACTIERSTIAKIGVDAIKAVGGATTGFTVSDNTVTESGASTATEGWRRLPRPSVAAITVGPNAQITRYKVLDAASNGIILGTNSTAADNYVTRICTSFNDCAGIYLNYRGNHSSITRNVVESILGNVAGLPDYWEIHAVGIYLDDGTTNAQITDNTVTNAEYGIQLHNANSSTVSRNRMIGNRRYQLWLQEQTTKVRASGDIFGNKIESNLFVPAAGGPNVFMESEIGNTEDFATFSNNHYSALFSERLVGERWSTGSASYNLDEWQVKAQDINSKVTQPTGYASFLSSGTNIVPNGNLINSWTGWTKWNPAAPYARFDLLPCSFGPCLQFTAGGSASLMSSPNFSVTGGQWYRVTFDAATSQEWQPIYALVRRGGGGSAAYEPLVPVAETFPGSTTWRRYSFLFQATKTVTANDPLTRELGARIDFDRVQPGTSVTVANLEIVAINPTKAALKIRPLVNPDDSDADVQCPASDAAADLCDKFIYLKDNSTVSWPANLGPRSGEAVYTRDTSLSDTDGDGVANIEDACPTTPPKVAVNARGCGFAE